MRIKEIKSRLRKWRDHYGGDIPNTDEIDAIKTKDDAYHVLEKHRTLMEDTLSDAMKDLDNFENEILK